MVGIGMGFGIVGLLLMVFFWGGLILLGVWLVKTIFQGSNQATTTHAGENQSPREILEQRYARGEITRDQYKIMKKEIQ